MTFYVWLSAVAPILLIGFALFYPAVLGGGIVFGVTVPLDFFQTAPGRAIRRNYLTLATLIVLLSVGAMTAAVLAHRMLAANLSGLGELALGLIAWSSAHRATRRYAIKVPLVRSARLSPSSGTGSAIAWQAITLTPLLLTGAYLRAHWSEIPVRFPVHWNAAGHVNGWSSRTVGGVFAPLLMGAATELLLLAFTAIAPMARQYEGGNSPKSLPGTMTAIAWLISALFSGVALLPLRASTGLPVFVSLAPMLIVVILAAAFYMQMRGRRKEAGEPYDGTPDSKWHGGIIYFNPEDRATIVPKRFGYGWTLNFARPVAWLLCALVLVLAAGSIAFRHRR